MRIFAFRAALVVLMSAVGVYACSSDDSDDDDPPAASSEQTESAAKALFSTKSVSGSLTDQDSLVRLHVRQAFQQFKAEQRLLEYSDLPAAICTAFNACTELEDTTIETDDVSFSCSRSCRGTDSQPLYSCTFANSFEKECEATGVTYTVAEGGTTRAGTSCEEQAGNPGTYDMAINGAYDFTISSSDGELDDTNFKCSWEISAEFDGDTSYTDSLGSGAESVIGDCETFSCTIDGATLSCEDLQEALEDEDNQCDS